MKRWKMVRNALALATLLCGLASADSNVRMVRLTDVQGDVKIDRGDGMTAATSQMPVPSGARIFTGADGRAEVQFEDGSVLRIMPSSAVTFNDLKLLTDGKRGTVASLESGEMYFDQSAKTHDLYELDVKRAQLTPISGTQLRVSLDRNQAEIAVQAGRAQVARGDGQQVEVRGNETLTLDFADPSRYYLAQGISDDPNDSWVEQRNQELAATAQRRAYSGSYGYPDYGYSSMSSYYNNPMGYGSYGFGGGYGFGYGYSYGRGYGYPGYFSNPFDWNGYYGINTLGYGGLPSCGSYFFDSISGQWMMNASPTWDSFATCTYVYSPRYSPVYWIPSSQNHPPLPAHSTATGTPTGHPNSAGGPPSRFVLNEDSSRGRRFTNADVAPAGSDSGSSTQSTSSPTPRNSSGANGTPAVHQQPPAGRWGSRDDRSRDVNRNPGGTGTAPVRPRIGDIAPSHFDPFGGGGRPSPPSNFHSSPPPASAGRFSSEPRSSDGHHGHH